jgi:hypothetical protein
MLFVKPTTHYKTSGMQPILLLIPDWFKMDSKDKMTYITFDLKACAGTGVGMPSFKKHLRTFDEGTPQEWMELLAGLQEIWQQNAVNGAHNCAATLGCPLLFYCDTFLALLQEPIQ